METAEEQPSAGCNRPDILREMKMCRLCLTNEEPLLNIYEKTVKDKHFIPLPLQIMACVSIEVSFLAIITVFSKNYSTP